MTRRVDDNSARCVSANRRGRARRVAVVAAALLLAVAATGCGDGGDGRVTVFAAASLRASFEEIGDMATTRSTLHPQFNFAGSQLLRTQLEQGARADVFASADRRQMDLARDAGLVGDAVVFATNRLVIVVPESNPAGVLAPADLGRAGLRLVIGGPQSPIGAYTQEALDALGAGLAAAIRANVVSEEPDVERVLTKVRLGEADAGIVYASDLTGAGAAGVRSFALPGDAQPRIEYVIAPVRDGDGDAARAFIALVLGDDGRAVLASRGLAPAIP